MNFDDIKLMWEKDSKIDDTELDLEALKIPQLHSKYLNLYSDFQLLKEKTEFDQKVIVRNLWEDYSTNYHLKILKQDIPKFIESDEEYQKVTNKLKYYSTIITFLKEVLNSINSRSFVIKNAIEWRKFTNGIV